MRILTFLHSFEPGGVERVALRLVARWRAMGVDAPLFMGRADGALRNEVAADLAFHTPKQPRLGSAWWETAWMILMLPGHIRRTAPDVLFCAGSTYTIVAVSMKLMLGRRCPPIVAKISNDLARADLPKSAQMLWRLWLKVQAGFIDRWVVMDPTIIGDVQALLGPVRSSTIADPAIDQLPPLPDPRHTAAGTRYVAVGRLAHQKDHATMLSGFAIAAGAHDRLTILGDGPLRKRLEQQAMRLGIASRVDFAGHVPNAAREMAGHDTLLLSSRYEGVPAVLAEALAVGLRVVATDCGPGVRSMLADGALGVLVPPGKPSAFARGITAASVMPMDIAAARQRAGAYTLDVSGPRYLNAFHAAIHEAGTLRLSSIHAMQEAA